MQQHLDDFRSDAGAIAIPPRELLRVSRAELHPLGISRLMTGGSSRFQSAYYWQNTSGLVARCFYLHPVAVRPRVFPDRVISTVDYRFVQHVCPDRSEIQIIDDSDDLFYVDLADLEHCAQWLQLEPYSVDALVEWMCSCTDELHHEYFTHSIVLHEDGNRTRLAPQLEQADAFARALLGRFRQTRDRLNIPLRESNILIEGTLPRAVAAVAGIPQVPRLYHRVRRRLLWEIRSLHRRLFSELYDRVPQLEAPTDTVWKAHHLRHLYQLERRIVQLEDQARGPTASTIR